MNNNPNCTTNTLFGDFVVNMYHIGSSHLYFGSPKGSPKYFDIHNQIIYLMSARKQPIGFQARNYVLKLYNGPQWKKSDRIINSANRDPSCRNYDSKKTPVVCPLSMHAPLTRKLSSLKTKAGDRREHVDRQLLAITYCPCIITIIIQTNLQGIEN